MLRTQWLVALILMSAGAYADVAQKNFKVSAQITTGCLLGSGGGAPAADFGTLSFGSMSSLYNNVDVASSAGAGSIVVACTPGMAVSIALDYGVNGGSATQRYMVNGSGNTLAYQLFQDINRSSVWGTNALAYSVASFPNTTQTYTVYGRLFATNGFPAQGSYTDTVTVTLTY
ncbi:MULTISPECIES: spore coat U domain-containing protein [Raoultella]|uniref:Csu type fimbrial protein n=1 Tax=Raoultella TaxID=160674 RepID=UPI00216AB26F|nr:MULTISPECIES: spore coat U domain-containing protein [Raoultella]MCS4273574.1 spore coat protein U-like protein [Raoultella sp. BIGb0132]MCS4290203.1 spore coat protein U-like protein [Raoultella terrigena]